MPPFDAPSHTGRNVLLLVAVIIVLFFATAYWRGGAPEIASPHWPAAVGAHASLQLNISDDLGVRAVDIFYHQAGRSLAVFQWRRSGRHWFFAAAGSRGVQLSAEIGRASVAGLRDGPASLVVEAEAANLRGARRLVTQAVLVSSVPPRIVPLSTQQYVHQGGCGMIVYRLAGGTGTAAAADPALLHITSGVEMAGDFFPGYPLPGAPPGTLFAFFAYPYNAPADALPRIVAHDDAGNEATANFPVQTFPEKFRTRAFPIDDAFIARIVEPIIAQTPGLANPSDPLQQFLLVNRDLRKTDAQELVTASQGSQPAFLWHGSFLALAHAAVEASFADHRIYQYDGKTVDQEDHLGYDLAVVRHTPVLAANDGRVVWTRYFGIYGNSILIDHGFGLMSLYAHLNDFVVKAGDTVQRGQLIAHSDSTGLAGGDHLHFSMLLDGVQVNPMEWWDPHWIEAHIQNKIQQFAAPARTVAATGPPSR